MAGRNGRIIYPRLGEEEGLPISEEAPAYQQEQAQAQSQPTAAAPVTTPAAAGARTLRQFGLSLVPTTPVAFSGPDAMYAYLRVGIYATATYLLWAKSRKLAYATAGAGALSMLTSLSAGAWNKASA